MMRAVIDTNVLISATFWTGKPKQLLNKVRRREITFLTSEVLLDELRKILVRPDKPFKLSKEETARVVKAMEDMAEIVKVHSRVSVCRHEPPAMILILPSCCIIIANSRMPAFTLKPSHFIMELKEEINMSQEQIPLFVDRNEALKLELSRTNDQTTLIILPEVCI
jgi:putative PIN family toxin of toxin-antitoxin system